MKAILAGAMAMLASQSPDTTAQSEAVAASIFNFVDAVNRGDMPMALGHFATDASITEDIAPFRWQGPGAGTQWLAAMQRNAERTGVTGVRMTLGTPSQVLVEGDDAYESVPGVLTLNGKSALHSNGMLTFALRRDAGKWKIVSLAWGAAAVRASP